MSDSKLDNSGRKRAAQSKTNEQKRLIADLRGQVDAINRSQAVIEFEMDGTIISANENFLDTMGYRLEEIQGRHHSIFVTAAQKQSPEYRRLWDGLARGQHSSSQFKRVGKGGREVWIQASYNPVLDEEGKPVKVVKFATDITERKRAAADYRGQVEAIGRSQAVIEFDLDGTIRNANENFLQVMGYTLEELQGRHHRMLVDPTYAASSQYRDLWDDLARGAYRAGEFQRVAKGGRLVWIQASYNPILDADGEPFKVVKYATDITEQKLRNADYEAQIAAIGKSQAVIEFEMDGTIRTANDGFLKAMGYRLDEVRGEHHRMFVDRSYAASREYGELWEQLQRGESVRGEFQRFAKGGREVWIEAAYNPIPGPNGKPVKVIKCAVDVTDKREAAKQLEDRASQLLESVAVASKGDLRQEIGIRGADVIGRIGEAMGDFLGGLRSNIQTIAAEAHELTRSADRLNKSSEVMRDSADRTRAQAEQTTATAEEVNHNTTSVATAADELNASIGEIAKSATSAAQVAASAVEAASQANEQVALLGDNSQEIGGVVKVIASIAEQTNLLALNATIEAARAGDAGKGFAVVANEVKELAKETATATEDIGRKIEAIQHSTKDAVSAIGGIGEIIAQINELQSTIASAVEQQNATTTEIGRSINEASQGSETIAKNIVEVARAAEASGERVNETQAAAGELSRVSHSLQEVVQQFKY